MKWFKKLIGFIIVLIAPICIVGQATMDGPKSIYQSPDGKLYIKSKQPLYLRLTTSPDDGGQSYLLKSQLSVEKNSAAQPFSFEGHGKHTIKHMADHRIPQKNKDLHTFYVYDDGQAPRTKVSVTKAPWVYNGNVNIYGKPVKITLKNTDSSSGVHSAYFSLNSPDFIRYNSLISLDQEMDYTLKFYAIDNVGNQSKERKRLYSLDFTPPTTRHKIIGGHINLKGEDILAPKSKIFLKSSDAKAGVKQIRYRFKGKRGIFKKKSLTMEGLKDGTHSIVYGAEDRVENAEANKTYNFYLDSVPPVVSHSLLGDQYRKGKQLFVSGRTTVELTATDNKAGLRRIRYYLPGKKGKTYMSPFAFPKKNGPLNYSYASSDNVLNVSETVKKSVIVDITAPKMKPEFKGEHYYSRKTHYIRLSTQISLSTTDNLSGVKKMSYVIDPDAAANEISYTKPFRISTEGLHVLAFTAADNVNNGNEQRSITLFVDEKPPGIYTRHSVSPTIQGQDIYPLKSLLYLSATDKESGVKEIYYSINNKKELRYKKPLSFKTRKKYTVKIRAIDHVGNMSKSQAKFEIR